MRVYNSEMSSESPEFTKKETISSQSDNEDSMNLNQEVSLQDFAGTSTRRRNSVTFAANTKPEKPENDSEESLSLDISAKDNSNRSVSFANNSSSPNSPKKGGQSRVAMMKARLNASFSKTAGGPDDMDASWGGALSLDDVSSSSEDSDDESEGSLGDFQDFGGNRSLNNSGEFRAKAQESVSFNASFMHLGDESVPKKKGISARGSIFLIDDDRFATTKVVQSRQNKAAIVMQRFFRRCLAVLRVYSEELKYFQDEKIDIEQRRVDELARYKEFIEEEKQRIKLELEQEFDPIKMSPEDWEAFKNEETNLKEEIQKIKEENFELKNECKELERQNAQLAIKDPVKEQERRKLEQEVKKLEKDRDLWKSINGNILDAVAGAERKIAFLMDKRTKKRDERKRIENCIAKIVELMESKQSNSNPDLVKKVSKLKKKREKKMKKLKADTIQETQLRKHGGGGTLEVHEENEESEEEDEKPAKFENVIAAPKEAPVSAEQTPVSNMEQITGVDDKKKKAKKDNDKEKERSKDKKSKDDKKKDKKSKKPKEEQSGNDAAPKTPTEKSSGEATWEQMMGKPYSPMPKAAQKASEEEAASETLLKKTAEEPQTKEADKKKKKDKDKKSKKKSSSSKKDEEEASKPKSQLNGGDAPLFSLISGLK